MKTYIIIYSYYKTNDVTIIIIIYMFFIFLFTSIYICIYNYL